MSDPGTSWHARLSRRLGAWPWARRWRAFWALLLHNIGLKLAAIIMAVALFSLVRGAEDAQRSLFVDVVALMPSARTRQVLISELPDQVKVTLRGSRSLLNAIERSDLEPLQIDLRRARRRYHYFDPTRLNLPAGVTVVQLAPSTVPLTWAARIDRRVPVQVRFLGTPGPGRSVLRPVQVRPSSLTLRGADTELKVLRSVYTAALDVRGLAVGRYQRWVAVEAAPPH
ncbi:MAG: CdaR family protein, partial [Polyangiales bacterium]